MSRSVLIIEDDPAHAGLLKDVLTEDGLNVVIAGDGETGLDVFADSPFDAVIVDVLLPRLQGFDLLPRLRKLPGGASVPVVMVSGDVRGDSYAERMEARHDIAAYLQKPVDLERLRNVLRSEAPRAKPGSREAVLDHAHRRFAEPPPLTTPLQGDLASIPFARVLGGLYSERRTGSLMLRKQTVKKLVYVQDGIPVFVKSNVLHECLGRIMVAERLITQEECDRSLARKHNEPHKRQGELLVEMGCISPHNLEFGLELQMQAKLFDVFSWSEGQYQFNENARYDGEQVVLSMGPAMLIYEGASRGMSTQAVRRDLAFAGDWMLVPSQEPSFHYQALQLDPRADRFLDRIDGTHTAEALINGGVLPVHDAALVLYALLCTSLVRVAVGSTEPVYVPRVEPRLPLLVDDPWLASAGDDEVTRIRIFGGPRGLNIPRRAGHDAHQPPLASFAPEAEPRLLVLDASESPDPAEAGASADAADRGPRTAPGGHPAMALEVETTDEQDPLATIGDEEWAREIDEAIDRSWATAIDFGATRSARRDEGALDSATGPNAPLRTAGASSDEPESSLRDPVDDVEVIIEEPVMDLESLDDDDEAVTDDIDEYEAMATLSGADVPSAEPLPADFVLSARIPDPIQILETARIPEVGASLGATSKSSASVESVVFKVPELTDWLNAEPLPEDLLHEAPLLSVDDEFDAVAVSDDIDEVPVTDVTTSGQRDDGEGVEPLPERVVFEAPVPEYYGSAFDDAMRDAALAPLATRIVGQAANGAAYDTVARENMSVVPSESIPKPVSGTEGGGASLASQLDDPFVVPRSRVFDQTRSASTAPAREVGPKGATSDDEDALRARSPAQRTDVIGVVIESEPRVEARPDPIPPPEQAVAEVSHRAAPTLTDVEVPLASIIENPDLQHLAEPSEPGPSDASSGVSTHAGNPASRGGEMPASMPEAVGLSEVGVDTGGDEVIRTEMATEGDHRRATGPEPVATEPVPTDGSVAEAPAVDPAAVSALAVDPAAVEAPAVDLAATEAPAVDPAAEALAVDPAAVSAPAVDPAAEAPAVDPAAEAPAVDPAAEAPAMNPAVSAPAVDPAAVEAPAVDPAAAEPGAGEPPAKVSGGAAAEEVGAPHAPPDGGPARSSEEAAMSSGVVESGSVSDAYDPDDFEIDVDELVEGVPAALAQDAAEARAPAASDADHGEGRDGEPSEDKGAAAIAVSRGSPVASHASIEIDLSLTDGQPRPQPDQESIKSDFDVTLANTLVSLGPDSQRAAEREATERELAARLKQLASLSHYEALGLPTDAEDTQIREARAHLESQFHPDRWTPDRLTARARRLTEQATLLIRRVADQLLDPAERIRYDRAIGLTSQPPQADPVEAELAYQLGRAAADREEIEDAERQFRRAVDRAPLEGEYLAALAEILSARDAWDEAKTLLERASDLSPRSRMVSLARARLHRHKADDEGAIAWYTRVLKIDPDCREAREFLAAQDRLFVRRTGLLSRLTSS